MICILGPLLRDGALTKPKTPLRDAQALEKIHNTTAGQTQITRSMLTQSFEDAMNKGLICAPPLLVLLPSLRSFGVVPVLLRMDYLARHACAMRLCVAEWRICHASAPIADTTSDEDHFQLSV